MNSSLWKEPDFVVKVFLTMLAKKDFDHVYRGDAYQLADESKKDELEVLEALKVLASPDRRKITPQAFEGRRIQAVDGGWLILNGDKYRDQVRLEMKRIRDAKAQAAARERRKLGIPPNPRPPRKPKVALCTGCGCEPSLCACGGAS